MQSPFLLALTFYPGCASPCLWWWIKRPPPSISFRDGNLCYSGSVILPRLCKTCGLNKDGAKGCFHFDHQHLLPHRLCPFQAWEWNLNNNHLNIISLWEQVLHTHIHAKSERVTSSVWERSKQYDHELNKKSERLIYRRHFSQITWYTTRNHHFFSWMSFPITS